MPSFYFPKLLKKTSLWLLPLCIGLLLSFESTACDGSGFTIDGLVDNGDGTYTITVTVSIAGQDWVGGLWGGTQGFFFGTDAPVVSVAPPSFTSANGTTLPAVVAGNNVNWGTPGAGPFFVLDTDPTQFFTFTLVVSGRPTSWSGGGQEINRCTYSGVFPCPLPTLSLLQGDQSICEGEGVALAVDAQGASSIVWSTGEVSPTIFVMPSMTTTYTVTALNECGPVDAAVTVFIDPLPQMDGLFDETIICEGDTVNLEVFPQFVDDIQWSPSLGNGPVIQVSPDIPTVYTAIGTNNCGVTQVSFTVDVNPYPFATALNDLARVCPGQEVTLEAFIEQEEIIYWSDGGSSVNTNSVSPTTTTSYTVYAGNFCGLDSAEFTVFVDSLPNITSINDDLSICPGDNVDLISTVTNANSYLWTPNGSTDSTLSVTPAATTTYTLVATNDCGDDMADVVVTVQDVIEEDLTLDACPGSTVDYNGESLPIGTSRDFTFVSSVGCDSIVSVVVEARPTFDEDLTLQACRGSSVVYDGQPLMPNTTTTFTFTADNGCDSTINVTVEEVATFTSDLNLETCPGTTVAYEGQDLGPNSRTDFSFLAVNGCDSIVTVIVAESPTFSSNLRLEACDNGTVAYNGQDLTPNSTTDFTFAARNGCDSVVTVTVDEIATLTSDLDLEACPGATIAYNGQALSPNTTTDFTLTAASGCDSVVTVRVAESPTFASNLMLEACQGSTTSYNGQTLNPNTTTDFTLTAANGCDSVVTVVVDEIATLRSNLDLETCPGTTVDYNGQLLGPNTTTDFTLTAVSGCDSVVTVRVAESPTFASNLTLQACQGSTTSYNGQSLQPNTTTDFTLTAANGCDSVVTVSVDEVATIRADLSLETCPGTTIDYDGQALAPNTSTDFTFVARNGCDSIVTVMVAESPTFSSDLNLEICPNTTASYRGQTLLPNSSTDFVLTAANGCDSIVTVIVDELASFTSTVALEACTGSTVSYNGQDLSPNSSTDFTFLARNGCDSVVTVQVAELATFSSDLTLEACTGSTTSYNGQDLNPNTVTDFTLTAANGCDSVVTVSVDEVNILMSNLTLQTCPNIPASYNGQPLQPNSTTDFTFTASTGCDSIVTVFVEEISTFTSSLDLEICAGTTTSYNGQTLLPNSSTDFTLSATNGCDSVVTVNVAELPVFASDLRLISCSGADIDYNGTSLPANSVTPVTLLAQNGCDSVVTVTVFAPDPSSLASSLTLVTCPGSTIAYNGQDLSPNTVTPFQFTSIDGCDSIVTVTVNPLAVFTEDVRLRACPGSTVDYNGTSLTPNSVTDFSFVASNGCDSIVTVTVDEVAVITESLDFQSCTGNNVDYNGSSLEPGSVTTFNFVASNGCDSIVTVTIEELEVFSSSLDFATCSGTTVSYNGQDLLPATTTEFTLIAANGCDSVVTVVVEELSVFNENITLQTCQGSPAIFNGQPLDPNTITTFPFTTVSGCDSIIVVQVEEVTTFRSTLDLAACSGSSASYRGQDLPAGSTTPFTLLASNGCDSVVTVVVEELDNFIVDVDLQACNGSSIDYNGTTLLPGSNQSFDFIASNGCDSMVNVAVEELPVFANDINLTACSGTSVTFDGQTLLPSSSTPFRYTAANGCDSVVTVNVQELDVFSSDLQLQACNGTTVDYNGSSLTPGSITLFNFTADNGCDSVVTVFVENLPTFSSDEVLQACTGTTASYAGQNLQPGSQTPFTLTAANGCDSVVMVTVEELETFSSSLQLQTCEGQATAYNGVSLEPFSVTDFTLTAGNGCDSVVTVFVSDVIPLSNSEEFVTLCFGDSLLAFGNVYTQTGDYPTILTSSDGCDSTHIIRLEVLPELEVAIESTNTCLNEDSGTAIATVDGGQPTYSYLWSNGQTEANLSELSSGTYVLTITDDFGCQVIEQTNVGNFDIELATEIQDISCFGYGDGIVTFVDPEPAWTFSLDGSNFSQQSSFTGLEAGSYNAIIQDENGCLYEERFVIDQPPLLIVSLPKDTLITLGNEVILYSNTNGRGNLTYEWTPMDDMECDNCPNPLVVPLQTTLYKLTVIDENDCIAEDEINVVVKNDFRVYIPNAFSPDNNGTNDRFTIFSDESVTKIRELRIYSRWGSQLYQVQDFLPNDPQYGWDGSYKGEQMNPGVYVYYTVVEFKDGNTKAFKGSVTLLK